MVRILNLLGTREPQVYGQTSLAEIDQELRQRAMAAGHELETFQSNHEGRWSIVFSNGDAGGSAHHQSLGPTRIPALLSVMPFWRWACQ